MGQRYQLDPGSHRPFPGKSMFIVPRAPRPKKACFTSLETKWIIPEWAGVCRVHVDSLAHSGMVEMIPKKETHIDSIPIAWYSPPPIIDAVS